MMLSMKNVFLMSILFTTYVHAEEPNVGEVCQDWRGNQDKCSTSSIDNEFKNKVNKLNTTIRTECASMKMLLEKRNRAILEQNKECDSAIIDKFRNMNKELQTLQSKKAAAVMKLSDLNEAIKQAPLKIAEYKKYIDQLKKNSLQAEKDRAITLDILEHKETDILTLLNNLASDLKKEESSEAYISAVKKFSTCSNPALLEAEKQYPRSTTTDASEVQKKRVLYVASKCGLPPALPNGTTFARRQADLEAQLKNIRAEKEAVLKRPVAPNEIPVFSAPSVEDLKKQAIGIQADIKSIDMHISAITRDMEKLKSSQVNCQAPAMLILPKYCE